MLSPIFVLQNDSGGYYTRYEGHGIHPHGVTEFPQEAKIFPTEKEAQTVLDEVFEDYSPFALFIVMYNNKKHLIESYENENPESTIL